MTASRAAHPAHPWASPWLLKRVVVIVVYLGIVRLILSFFLFFMRTSQDYDQWHIKKQKLNHVAEKRLPNVQVGQVWWYYCGVNVWNEIGKGVKGRFSRPCLILKTNLRNDLVLVAPISTKINQYNKWNTIKLHNYGRDARVVCNQVCLIDRRRFTNRFRFSYPLLFVRRVIDFYKSIINL